MGAIKNFEKLSADERRWASSKGGRRAFLSGNTTLWTAETARAAALVSVANRRARQLLAAQVLTTGWADEYELPLPFSGVEEGL